MTDFVASVLFMDGGVFDEYSNAFGVDIDEYDVMQALDDCCGHWSDFGRNILRIMWDKVISEFSHVLDVDKFDYDFSSPSYPWFYYDGEYVESRDELEALAEEQYDKEGGFVKEP